MPVYQTRTEIIIAMLDMQPNGTILVAHGNKWTKGDDGLWMGQSSHWASEVSMMARFLADQNRGSWWVS